MITYTMVTILISNKIKFMYNLLYRTAILLFILLLISTYTSGQKYVTINDGCWLDETIWQEHKVPSLKDSVIIKNNIIFPFKLVAENGFYIHIDSTASLCIMDSFALSCGTFFYNYGLLNIESFIMRGDGANYGIIKFRKSYKISPCNIAYYNAQAFGYAGALDSCLYLIKPTTCFYNAAFNIYPNPFIDILNIELGINYKQNINIYIYDLYGKQLLNILNKTMEPGEYIININNRINNLTSGIYILHFIINDDLVYKYKLLKL